MNWGELDFQGLANAVLTFVIAAVGLGSVMIGRRAKALGSQKEPQAEMKVQGAAIVSSESVMALAAAVEAANADRVADRLAVKTVADAIIEALTDLTDQLKELRLELARRR